ncbi:hypothetical protein PO587_30105 [Streptomyces gilvifuscus]|uniref:Uncharacterized protein n=1 Tax=Streptomyces gilvifuscus TaxID=1550617 RepID=A0ABT5G1I9_9ACTN|nr:hypothetical protein [Streptomyces gilvifuscus]MDC2958701.1 hypothetical protein [Streptomyces gilvifuscus]
MITHSDEGPDIDPEDPLTVLLRPPAGHLGPPPGRYRAIRRGAARRRLLKAAAGAALTCGVAALAILPLRLSASDSRPSPVVPLAPPPASSPSTLPPDSPTPRPSSSRPTPDPRTGRPTTSSGETARSVPTAASPTRSTRTPTDVPSVEPSAVRSAPGASPGQTTRR